MHPTAAATVVAMLNWLGVKPSYSRPRVSDDNAYAEALFRTAKYRPEFPSKGFESLDAAREWAASFVRWYNVEHRHSGIAMLTPAQVHYGNPNEVLKQRHQVAMKAWLAHPERFIKGPPRLQTLAAVAWINPPLDSMDEVKVELA